MFSMRSAARDVGEVAGGRGVGAGPNYLVLEQREGTLERDAALTDGRVEQADPLVLRVHERVDRPGLAEEPLGRRHGRSAEATAAGRARIERARGPLQPAELGQQLGAIGAIGGRRRRRCRHRVASKLTAAAEDRMARRGTRRLALARRGS
jgi:hypothetical protein